MSIDQLLEISKALLTPAIAIVTTYIAWQQWKANQQKSILDRYDRRLKVYGEVRQILSVIFRDAKASYDDLLKFRMAVSEADFLFGSEIPDYIDEIYQRGVKLSTGLENTAIQRRSSQRDTITKRSVTEFTPSLLG